MHTVKQGFKGKKAMVLASLIGGWSPAASANLVVEPTDDLESTDL